MGVIVLRNKEDFLKMVNEQNERLQQPNIKESSTQYIDWGLSKADRDLLKMLTDRVDRAAMERELMKRVDKENGMNITCIDCARLTIDHTCKRGLNVMNTDYIRIVIV